MNSINTCPLNVGVSVECNGYPGTLSRICEWSESMVEVRLSSGTVCVDYHEIIRAMSARPSVLDQKALYLGDNGRC